MSTRCYASPECWTDDFCVLDKDESHHLLRVLRKKTGDEIEVFDGKGRTARAVLDNSSEKKLNLKLLQIDQAEKPAPPIHLFIAVIKNQRMDWLLQKATELGITSITPMQSEHCVVKKTGSSERRHRILINAAKQCGMAWLPELHPVQPLDDQLTINSDFALVGAIHPDAKPLKSVLKSIDSPNSIAVYIGPEGDFTDDELHRLMRKGAVPVSLGRRILRSETAGVYILSVLQYVFSNIE